MHFIASSKKLLYMLNYEMPSIHKQKLLKHAIIKHVKECQIDSIV